MLVSSQAAGTLTLPTLSTLEMKVVILNREDAKDHVKAYPKAYGRYPSDANIKDYL